MIPFQRILVPVDGSEPARQAVDTAVRLARAAGGRVRLVHVVDEMEQVLGDEYGPAVLQGLRRKARRMLDEGVAACRACGVECDEQLVESPGHRLGDIVAAAAAQWPADLVLVGSHGRRGPARAALGSGAEQVLRACATPVLVVRGA